MASVGNTALFIGRLARDPEFRNVGDRRVLNFTLIRNEYAGKGKDSKVIPLRCTAWNDTADLICKHFTKGSRFGIVGSLEPDNYEKGGQQISTIGVRVDRVEFIDKVESGSSYESKPKNTQQSKKTESFDTLEDEDTDLPF